MKEVAHGSPHWWDVQSEERVKGKNNGKRGYPREEEEEEA